MRSEHAHLLPGVEFITMRPDAASLIPAGAESTSIRVTRPPRDPGTLPHRYARPIFGYVAEGEILFELAGHPLRVVKAGDAHFEPGRRNSLPGP